MTVRSRDGFVLKPKRKCYRVSVAAALDMGRLEWRDEHATGAPLGASCPVSKTHIAWCVTVALPYCQLTVGAYYDNDAVTAEDMDGGCSRIGRWEGE